MEARLSAIIPTYNSGALLDRCLDALAAAPGVDDIVVLDGGSTDGAPDRAEGRPSVRVFRLPGTVIATRLNRGVREARNELVLLVDDDAFFDPEAPGRLAATLQEHARLALVQAHLRFEDGREQKSGSTYKTLLRETLNVMGLERLAGRLERTGTLSAEESGLEPATWVPLCAALMRRSAFQEVGGFDERYRFYYEDHDFCRTLVEAGWEIAVQWDATAVHIKGAATAAKDPTGWFGAYQANRFTYLRKHYPRGWRVFAVFWAGRASLHVVAWWLRAVIRRVRSDAEGARQAREWARAFKSAVRPPASSRALR